MRQVYFIALVLELFAKFNGIISMTIFLQLQSFETPPDIDDEH